MSQRVAGLGLRRIEAPKNRPQADPFLTHNDPFLTHIDPGYDSDLSHAPGQRPVVFNVKEHPVIYFEARARLTHGKSVTNGQCPARPTLKIFEKSRFS